MLPAVKNGLVTASLNRNALQGFYDALSKFVASMAFGNYNIFNVSDLKTARINKSFAVE